MQHSCLEDATFSIGATQYVEDESMRELVIRAVYALRKALLDPSGSAVEGFYKND